MYWVPLTGNEANLRGIISIPYVLRRFRRSRVYGGFVFVLCARWFRVVSLVASPALALFAVVSFCQINHLFRNVRKYRKFGFSCLSCLESAPRLLGGGIGRPGPCIPRFGGGQNVYPAIIRAPLKGILTNKMLLSAPLSIRGENGKQKPRPPPNKCFECIYQAGWKVSGRKRRLLSAGCSFLGRRRRREVWPNRPQKEKIASKTEILGARTRQNGNFQENLKIPKI